MLERVDRRPDSGTDEHRLVIFSSISFFSRSKREPSPTLYDADEKRVDDESVTFEQDRIRIRSASARSADFVVVRFFDRFDTSTTL